MHAGDCPPSKRPRATTSKEADAAIQDAKDAIDAAEQHVQQEANAPEEVHCKFLKAAKHGDTSQVRTIRASIIIFTSLRATATCTGSGGMSLCSLCNQGWASMAK